MKCTIDTQIRSSSFLGVSVGLDPVRSLSKSGLEPNQDDQDASKMQQVQEATKSYESVHAGNSRKWLKSELARIAIDKCDRRYWLQQLEWLKMALRGIPRKSRNSRNPLWGGVFREVLGES